MASVEKMGKLLLSVVKAYTASNEKIGSALFGAYEMRVTKRTRDTEYVSFLATLLSSHAQPQDLKILRNIIEFRLDIPSLDDPEVCNNTSSMILKFYFDCIDTHFLCAFLALVEKNARSEYYFVLKDHLEDVHHLKKKELVTNPTRDQLAKMSDVDFLRLLLAMWQARVNQDQYSLLNKMIETQKGAKKGVGLLVDTFK